MSSISINIPKEYFTEISKVAVQLKKSPEECVQLAIDYFLQTDAVDNAIDGIARIEDGEPLIDFPELKTELGIEIKFHPQALLELEAVSEEDQIEILEELINRIVTKDEDPEEGTLDLVLKEEGLNQLLLSSFDFGDVVYQVGQNISIYYIALLEDEDDEDDDELEIEDELEDEALEEALEEVLEGHTCNNPFHKHS